MNNKFEDIYNILKQDKRIVSEDGNILKNKLSTLAMNMDENLLNILISNDITKDLFFKKIDNILVFDKIKFSWIINSKDFLPDSYTAFKNKIMLVDDNGESIKNSSNVVLSFPFKDCILEADSTKETEERNEIFFNEVLMKREIDTLLAPKVFTNAKRYSLNGIEDVTTLNDDDNLIIKGNNLLVLHSLVPKYKNKVKCMYWDVLYNTQSDKVPYNDSFKHSSWLVMMKNRLEVARELLSEDGFIAIQCDDNEMAYLKVLCDEIFTRENLLNVIVVEMASTGGLKRTFKDKKFLKTKEYILIYSKNSKVNINPLYNSDDMLDKHYSIFFDGKEYTSLNNKIKELFGNINISQSNYLKDSNVKKFIIENSDYIWRLNGHSAPNWVNLEDNTCKTIYENDTIELIEVTDKDNTKTEIIRKDKTGKSIDTNIFNLTQKVQVLNGEKDICTLRGDLWKDFHKDMGNVTKEGNVKLSNGKKPERLIRDLITAFTKEGDLVLDAYMGSGTTASVAHKMNRQYIGIEQLDSHYIMSMQRLKNVVNGDKTGISKSQNWNGRGSFVYCELKSLSQEFIDKILSSNNNDLNKLYNELKYSEFITYRIDINNLEQNKEGFSSLTEDEKRKFLIEIIDKNMLYVNYSEIEDESYNISEEDKKFNKSFYKKEV